MDNHGLAKPSVVHGIRRLVYAGLGLLFLGLAVLGAFLPVLPTTPFLLLTSYFFVRSWPRLNERLLRSRLFGGLLRDWQRHRGVRPRVKVTAVVVLLTAVTASAVFANLSWPWLALLGVLGLTGLVVVIRLPVVRDGPHEEFPTGRAHGLRARIPTDQDKVA